MAVPAAVMPELLIMKESASASQVAIHSVIMGQSLSLSSSPTPESKAQVQQLIQNNKVIVFAKVTCPYCAATKMLLKKKGVTFESVNVDTTSGGSRIFSTIKEMTGQRTVPNIFIGQKQIGGNSELQELNKTGELDNLLKMAGAI